MTIEEAKEQAQQDVLTVLDGHDIEDVLDEEEFESLKDALCAAIVVNFNKISNP